jgi:hypothetical protein
LDFQNMTDTTIPATLPVVAWQDSDGGGSFISDYAKKAHPNATWPSFYEIALTPQAPAQEALEALRAEVERLTMRCENLSAEGKMACDMVSRITAERDAAREDARRWNDIQPVLNFLQGVSPLEGVHFGELHPTRKGRYWWRRLIDSARGVPEDMNPSTQESK